MPDLIRYTDSLDTYYHSNRSTRRAIQRTTDRTMVAAHQESGKGVVAANRVNAGAYVARTALINIALLSREEEQLIQMAPLAEPRMRAIVDVYAIFAAGELGRL